eukprot:TRINITY_DN15906_c0_g1_i1.p2 TRINITY_DN15906_c0_g1~~TRINITY_DN15906_c0_g1_i1.p2  ORF type:complete len:104 (+),score=5.79 TRINITY_DN15906_c0_g1_i1:19-330(+)
MADPPSEGAEDANLFFDDEEPPGPVCNPHAPADPRPSPDHVDGTAGVRFLRAGTRTPVPISAEAYARALQTARQVECGASRVAQPRPGRQGRRRCQRPHRPRL